MDKNGLPWEENDYVKMNICIQINGLKMQQFWTDSLDDPVDLSGVMNDNLMTEKQGHVFGAGWANCYAAAMLQLNSYFNFAFKDIE